MSEFFDRLLETSDTCQWGVTVGLIFALTAFAWWGYANVCWYVRKISFGARLGLLWVGAALGCWSFMFVAATFFPWWPAEGVLLISTVGCGVVGFVFEKIEGRKSDA